MKLELEIVLSDMTSSAYGSSGICTAVMDFVKNGMRIRRVKNGIAAKERLFPKKINTADYTEGKVIVDIGEEDSAQLISNYENINFIGCESIFATKEPDTIRIRVIMGENKYESKNDVERNTYSYWEKINDVQHVVVISKTSFNKLTFATSYK